MAETTNEPHLTLMFNAKNPDGLWVIAEGYPNERQLWSRRSEPDEDTGEYNWPADMRAEFERLTGKPEFDANWQGMTQVNLVEMLADPDECAMDTPCAFGNRVGGHATYCHNDGWLYSPRKCRREVEGDHRFCNCPGFKPLRPDA